MLGEVGPVQMFKENPDSQNPKFCTKVGIYHESCGLDQVVMSWGHDEYMYQVRALPGALRGEVRAIPVHLPLHWLLTLLL